MKGRLNLLVALIFNVAAIKALTMTTQTGVWLMFIQRVPFLRLDAFDQYIFYGLHGIAALAALTMFIGAKPRGLKGLYSLALLVLTAIYVYETIDFVTFSLGFGGELKVTETLFLGLGSLLSFYLLVKVRITKVKRRK